MDRGQEQSCCPQSPRQGKWKVGNECSKSMLFIDTGRKASAIDPNPGWDTMMGKGNKKGDNQADWETHRHMNVNPVQVLGSLSLN